MPFELIIPIDIGDDTEKDFINEVIAQNEGAAIQALALGKLTDYVNVTDAQKKQFVIQMLGEQYSNIYHNAKDERAIVALRNQLKTERENKRNG